MKKRVRVVVIRIGSTSSSMYLWEPHDEVVGIGLTCSSLHTNPNSGNGGISEGEVEGGNCISDKYIDRAISFLIERDHI